jgi:hypothetical protein
MHVFVELPVEERNSLERDVEHGERAPTYGRNQKGAIVKYIMMMHTPGKDAYQIANWPAEDIRRHIDFMKRFAETLIAKGEWVSGEGLAGPDQAKLVRAGNDGRPITDGIFPESKEFLAGYWIVDVESPERAYALAAQASAAPGKGGKPLNMGIEVRQVMDAPPTDYEG